MGKFDHLSGLAVLYKDVAGKANEIAGKIKASRDKPDDALDNVLTTSDDETIQKWRAFDEKIAEQIKAATARREQERANAKAYAGKLLPQAEEGFDVDKAKGEFTALRAEAHTMHNAVSLVLKTEEAVKEFMDEFGIVEVVSLKGGGASGSGSRGSTNIRRPRITTASVDGVAVEKDGKASFTLLTQYLSKTFGTVDADSIRKAAFGAAGTEDLSSLTPGTVVEFDVVIKGATHKVAVTTLGKGEAESEVVPEQVAEGEGQDEVEAA